MKLRVHTETMSFLLNGKTHLHWMVPGFEMVSFTITRRDLSSEKVTSGDMARNSVRSARGTDSLWGSEALNLIRRLGFRSDQGGAWGTT